MFRVGFLCLLQRLNPKAKVLEANDHDKVLDIIARKESIDLILVEFFMPGTGGFSDIFRLRDSDRAALIVVVSARESPADVQAAL